LPCLVVHCRSQIVTERNGKFRSVTQLDGPEGPSYGRFQPPAGLQTTLPAGVTDELVAHDANRKGRSAAEVTPIRGVAKIVSSSDSLPSPIHSSSPLLKSHPSSDRSMSNASHNRPGPQANSRSFSRPRRRLADRQRAPILFPTGARNLASLQAETAAQDRRKRRPLARQGIGLTDCRLAMPQKSRCARSASCG